MIPYSPEVLQKMADDEAYTREFIKVTDDNNRQIRETFDEKTGYSREYIGGLTTFNPTSKTDDQDNGFGIGFSVGNFSLGYTSGNLPQWGERIDYNAFLIQAGTILRTNRFMATLFFPGGNPKLSRASSYACEEILINEQRIEANEYRMNMMPPIMVPYMRNFGGTITLTFRMFIGNESSTKTSFGLNLFGVNLSYPPKSKITPGTYQIEPRRSLLEWQNQIVNFDGSNAGVNYFDNYTKDTSIIISMLNPGSTVLKNVEFLNVYPIEVGGLNPSWDGQNVYMKQTATFAFTRIVDSAYGRGFVPPELLPAITSSVWGNNPLPPPPELDAPLGIRKPLDEPGYYGVLAP